MRLRNKKTGEIIELLAKPSFVKRNDDYLQSEVNTFDSLAELNEEWEDYEEPKTSYWIDSQGGVHEYGITAADKWTKEKQIGNYFETKEEAEQAVKKLKAWKRLQSQGFHFLSWEKSSIDSGMVFIAGKVPPENWKDVDQKDLDLLFGGEE